MDIEAQVRRTLAGSDHELIDCDPELADTAAFCAHYGYPKGQSANTILVASRRPPGESAACVVLATTRLDVNNRVRRLMGVRKASFAPAEVTSELTGMLIGGVTPFGTATELPLWIDARVLDRDRVIVGGGSRDRKLLVPPETLLARPGAEVVEGLAAPAA